MYSNTLEIVQALRVPTVSGTGRGRGAQTRCREPDPPPRNGCCRWPSCRPASGGTSPLRTALSSSYGHRPCQRQRPKAPSVAIRATRQTTFFMRTLLDFSYGRSGKRAENVVELRIVQNRLTIGWGWRGIRDRGSGSRLGLWFGYRLIWQWRQPATGPLRREIWRFRHRHCMAIPHALIADP